MSHTTEAIASAAVLDHEWDKRALDWPLTKDSTVVEVGGYKGRWALQIADRYGPRLFVFEPQQWAYDVCRDVLGERATVYNIALGIEDAVLPMGKWETDGCSFLEDDGHYGNMVEIDAFLQDVRIGPIDLMLINIEGYEYTLIPHMLRKDIYPARLMVQFHGFADPDGTKTERIFRLLADDGYTIPWSYGKTLTAWERCNA